MLVLLPAPQVDCVKELISGTRHSLSKQEESVRSRCTGAGAMVRLCPLDCLIQNVWVLQFLVRSSDDWQRHNAGAARGTALRSGAAALLRSRLRGHSGTPTAANRFCLFFPRVIRGLAGPFSFCWIS